MGLLDTAYDELRKPRAMGLRVGDFVPYVSGLLAADDARLAAQQGNYGEVAGALAGFIPGGAVVKKLTGVDLGSVSPRQIFAGKKAKGADLEAMNRAEARLSAGDDPRKVWSDEGWFRGPDGQMRWEIDDRRARVNQYGPGKNQIETVHGLLEESYPGIIPKSLQGKLLSGPNSAALGVEKATGNPVIAYDNTNKPRNTSAVHELQHVVQDKEGFARGGSPDEFRNQAGVSVSAPALAWREDVEAYARRNKLPLSAAESKLISEYTESGVTEFIPKDSVRKWAMGSSFNQDNPNRSQIKQQIEEYGLTRRTAPYSPHEAYSRLAGESESRLAESRMMLTPSQRRKIYPEYEYDGELIFRGLLGGTP
jgi:hypothetical protein